MPISEQQIDAWKGLIAEDRLLPCLDDMMEASEQLPAPLANQIISLNARLHGLARDRRLGVLGTEEEARRRARIRLDLLELLPRLNDPPAQEEADPDPAPAGPVTGGPQGALSGAVPVFVSWSGSEADRTFKSDLEKQLTLLRRSGKVSLWDKSRVPAGEEVAAAQAARLAEARLFLVLLSQDYFFSDDCFQELEAIQRARSNRGARVVPILVRSCQYDLLPIGRLQILPRDKRPIAERDQPDGAWAAIAREIHALVENL